MKNITFHDAYGGAYEASFHVMVSEYHAVPVNAKNQQFLLDSAIKTKRDIFENQEGGQLVASEEITVNGHRGMDLVWRGGRHSSGGTNLTASRVVVAGNRVYSLQAGVFEQYSGSFKDDILRFLRSLKIHKVTP